MSLRVRCLLVLAALGVFLVLMLASAALYPGGNYYDRHHPRHHFWYNFLCDLLRTDTLGGGNNLWGARLAMVGMLVLAVALGAYWTLAPALTPSRTWMGTVGSVAGVLSALGMVAVALTPSDKWPQYHTASIALAGLPGLLAGLLVVAGRLAEPNTAWSVVLLGVLMITGVAFTLGVFVVHTWFGGGFIRTLATFQRGAAIVALLWIGWTTLEVMG